MVKRRKKITISLGAVRNALDAFRRNDPDLHRRALDAIFVLRDKVYENVHFASPEWSHANHDWIDGFIIKFEAWTERFRIHEIYTSGEPLPPFAGFAVKAEADHIRIKLSDVRDVADAFRNQLQIELGQLDRALGRRDKLICGHERAAVKSLDAQILVVFAADKRCGKGAPALERLTLAAIEDAKLNDFHGMRMALAIVLARHRLMLDDCSGALELASEAVTIAARFGFQYKKAGLRRLIGRIMIARGDIAAGQALLRHTHAACDGRNGLHGESAPRSML